MAHNHEYSADTDFETRELKEIEEYFLRTLPAQNPDATPEDIQYAAQELAKIIRPMRYVLGKYEITGQLRKNHVRFGEELERAEPWELDSHHED